MKPKYKKIVSAIVFICSITTVNSQNIDSSYILSFNQEQMYYQFKNNIYVDGSFNFKPNIFRLGENISLELVKSKSDELNWTHNKYLNYYNGIPIENSEFIVHCKSGTISYSGNGLLVSDLNIITEPSIDEAIAIEKAIKKDGAEIYAWNDSFIESELKTRLNDQTATYYPKPMLTIIFQKLDLNYEYKLAYKVRLVASKPYQAYEYYIDATNGDLIKKRSLMADGCFSVKSDLKMQKSKLVEEKNTFKTSVEEQSSCGTCNANTATLHYYGNQTIYNGAFNTVVGDEGATCKYITRKNCSNIDVTIHDGINLANPNNPTITTYTNTTSSWGTNSKSGTTGMFCVDKALEFYKNKFNRNSYNNLNGDITMITRDPNLQSNAFWSLGTRTIVVGTAGGNIPYELLNIDVIGHEFTHGVNDFEANLVYQDESGALDESFADIFGTMVEFYTKPLYTSLTPNYLIAEEAFGGSNSLRDMSNPNNKNQPDTYRGSYWVPTGGSNDYGGVHTNSGVQNFWFYLISEGGSGVNDLGNAYCVESISREKAMRIAYRNLTTYLTSTSGYSNARDFSIQSAIDLYGVNSFEVAQVKNAWFAVGLIANNPLVISNQTILTPQTVYWNNKISLQNVSISNGHYDLSSGTQIAILPDVSINSNTSAAFYIYPDCVNSQRLINQNGSIANSGENEVKSNEENELVDRINNSTLIIPNPTKSLATILLDESKEYPREIILRDSFGKKLNLLDNIGSFEIKIELTDLPDGLYLINIIYDSNVFSKKVLKITN